MSDDTTTPVVLIGLVIIVAATLAATVLLLPLDDDPRIEPADTVPPTPAPTVFTVTNLPPPLTVHATVVSVALRGPAIQVSEPPPAPTTTQLVFADDCDEMSWYRQQVGLPERFDKIGYRESRCRNEEQVHTYCCWGWWQLYVSVHLADHRLGPRYAACGISSRHDIDSDTPEDKTRQACGAKAVYDVQGAGAWST